MRKIMIILIFGLLLIPQNNFCETMGNDEEISTEYSQIKIMAYNIQESGVDPDWKEVVREENADVIIFVETGDCDDYAGDGFGATDFSNLVIEINSYFPQEIPYQAFSAQNIPYDTSGEAIFSRFPVLSFTQINSVTLDSGAPFTPSHDFIDAEINVSNTLIHVIGAHLKCCGGSDNIEKREKAQEGINNYMDALGEVPILYLGDLNTFSPEDTGPLAPSGDLGYTVIPMLTDENNIHACVYHDFFDVFRTINPSDPGFTYISSSYESRIDFIFANEFFEGKFSNATTGDTVSALSASDNLSVDAILALSENQTTSTSSQQTSTTTSSDVDSITTKTTSLIISLDLVGIGLIFVYMKRKQLKNT